MTAKSLGKKVWDYVCLTASVIAAVASTSSAVKADDNRVLGSLRPMQTLEEVMYPPPNAFRQNLEAIEDFSENRLWGIPQKYANWYLADLLMVLYHEVGHYEEAQKQGLSPSLTIQPTPFWVNGWVNRDGESEDKIDNARRAIAGFVNAGNLAENLKRDILLGNVAPENLKIMSMLALVSELNLPFYLGQHYAGTIPDENSGDIGNFSKNTGISPETMAISSGLHLLINAPYMWMLAKNAFGSYPTMPEKKDYFVSFRYNGDSYMINFHSDLNTIVEKIPKPRFMLMNGEN